MSAEYHVGTVARVRVGEWEGRAVSYANYLDDPWWALLGHPDRPFASSTEVAVVLHDPEVDR